MLEISKAFWEQAEIIIFCLRAKIIIQKSYKCCQIFTGHLTLRIFICYAIIVNPMTKMIFYKKRELYRNDIYMMRKLNTASEEYIESFNKSYYHNYNCCPLKPEHCSGMFVTRLCCGADLYLTCFLLFLKHKFICVTTSSISRFVTKMEYLK